MQTLLKLSLLLFVGIASQAIAAPMEFYVSNNQGEINIETAYKRLVGEEQKQLRNEVIEVMQRNHMQQGRCDDLLGNYQMANATYTADNSKVYAMSPYQKFTKPAAFKVANQLAVQLHQESVAVFVPQKSMDIGKVEVRFTTHKPTITELTTMLSEKLPADFNQAYSLQLENDYGNFNESKVAEIRWLGHKDSIQTLQAVFQDEEVKLSNGAAYLVYQDGHVAPI